MYSIDKKVQIIKRLIKFILTQPFTKLNDFMRESGEFLCCC